MNEEPEITVTEIQEKINELPRDSEKRALLRMLSVGIRPKEIAAISNHSPHSIRRQLHQTFPEVKPSPHDFRKLFASTLIREDVSRGHVDRLLNWSTRDTYTKFKQFVEDTVKIDNRESERDTK